MKSHMFLDLFGNKSDDSIEFKQFIFKGGENYFKLVDADNVNYSHVTIRFTYHNDGSLFLLASAVDALRRLNRYIIIDLIIPYFPGARQDRVCVKGEAFSLQIYADFINNLNFNRVTVFDPHSDVTPA